ncbi:hypothetical protein CTRI78_v011148 [Colletotrichum trifolii]|uniref:Uncharacterized protein n=1 Tax=Colletotrichum trifolii TaxID=5466 RepID=A0A4R8QEQ5_COLTR|nr:hypothetical protein CTRI78_v011148 [Colletotrichum trifolii]
MAPQQKTFSVIPNGPGRASGAPSKPPMTSKQAQKLYKKQNREPRRSKAEQRKWEKERQEEIRKELERDRAAVKAKAAREKKKAKEDEERENRRRNGQPLIDCRPSQDTIARFVRGNGTHRKRDSSGEPVPHTREPSIASVAEKPPCPVVGEVSNKVESSTSEPLATKLEAQSMPPPPRPLPSLLSSIVPVPLAPSQRKPSSVDPTLPLTPSADANTASLRASRGPPAFVAPPVTTAQTRCRPPVLMGPPSNRPVKSKTKPKPFMMPKTNLAILPLAEQRVKRRDVKDVVSEKFEQKPITKDIVEEKPAEKESTEPTPAQQKSTGESPSHQSIQHLEDKPVDQTSGQPGYLDGKATQKTREPGCEAKRKSSVQENLARYSKSRPSSMPHSPKTSLAGQMPPPPVPRSKMAALPLGQGEGREGSSPQLPPPSTQAIINDCFDDFFPTASQLALELEDDDAEDGPGIPKDSTKSISAAQSGLKKTPPQQRNTGEKSQTSTSRPVGSIPVASLWTPVPQGPHRLQAERKPYPTRAPNGHSGPKRPVTVCTKQPRTIQQKSGAIQPRPPLKALSNNRPPEPHSLVAAKSAPVFDEFFSFICTQDLVMSSQEVLDIESPAKVDSQPSSEEQTSCPSPLIDMDLMAIDWDDDLDDF